MRALLHAERLGRVQRLGIVLVRGVDWVTQWPGRFKTS